MVKTIILAISGVIVTASWAGTLTIMTDPPGLDVWVEGEIVGRVPVVVEGPYGEEKVVVVKAEGYEDLTRTVKIPGGEGTAVVLLSPASKARFSSMSFIGGLALGAGVAFMSIYAIVSSG